MSLFGGKPKTTDQIMKEQRRQLGSNQREIDREILKLDRQEKQLTIEIRKLAAQGQNSGAKTLARELVRVRKQKEQLLKTKSTLSGVSHKTTVTNLSSSSSSSFLLFIFDYSHSHLRCLLYIYIFRLWKLTKRWWTLWWGRHVRCKLWTRPAALPRQRPSWGSTLWRARKWTWHKSTFSIAHIK